MSKNEIVKRPAASLKERGQYAVALSLIGVMLYVAGFPVFFLLFVGVLAYFVWKIFSSEARSDVRRVFEFYLSANEILRDDYRRWYGFEIQQTIAHGESIVRAIPTAPPLVHFALGALYDRLGDHSSAVKHLSFISEDTGAEAGIVFPSNELREYVRILRKIERSPAEAPQTSAAIRSLERLRKSKTKGILGRNQIIQESVELRPTLVQANERSPFEEISSGKRSQPESTFLDYESDSAPTTHDLDLTAHEFPPVETDSGAKNRDGETRERKTISEVLHDIYDENVQ